MTEKVTPEEDPGRPAIGEKLRARRRELKLTLKDVADAAGLSTGFMSQAERDIAVPSLASLHNICRVLKLPIQDVLPETIPAPETSRYAARPLMQLKKDSPQAATYERISTTFPGSELSSVIIHEAPGFRTEPQSHDGEEIFYILDGEITMELEGERYVLGAGDSIHFSSRRLHVTWNHTDRTTVILHVCTLDVFGDRIAADETQPGIHAGHEDARRAVNSGDR